MAHFRWEQKGMGSGRNREGRMENTVEEKKISVIIPVFNTVNYLSECLESVTGQSYKNLEIVIIDDSSDDGSGELCEEWAKKDERIRVVHKANDGVSVARNHGIAMTDGDYVTFVDADDKIDKNMLTILAEQLDKSGSDMAMCSYHFWHGEKTGEENDAAAEKDMRKLPAGTFRTVDKETYVKEYLLNGNTRCWSILYRRKCVEYRGFRVGMSIGEDMLLLVDMLPLISEVSITDYKGYYYRLNEKGVMNQAFRPSYMDQITCWEQAAEQLLPEFPECREKLLCITAVSAMLTAGKLAAVSGKERRQYRDYIDRCRTVVKEVRKNKGAVACMDSSYRLKTAVFASAPALYLNLYHIWKK